MVFSSFIFLIYFLPITVLGYYLMSGKGKNLWLLLASLIFYAWGEPKYIILMLVSILINYGLGLLIETGNSQTGRKAWMIFSVIYNLGILVWFKYLHFFADTVDTVFGLTLVEQHPFLETITMPIGISFFTFQILSYVIDVYRKDVKAQRNPLKLALYISLFPQLIAGPIVRYIDVAEQIEHRTVTFDKAYQGTVRFMRGFIKKVLLSNTLAQVATMAFDDKLAVGSMSMAWMGIICYSLQIYFDFSGYSDMAIGLGKIFGFDFLENFNYPYISGSVREFWRRWHISLSSWFRDYLYIPLGGSRKGAWRTYRNLFIVFFVTGLWHGASYNFILWGLFHGVFLVLERWKLGAFLERIPRVFRHIYTLLIVMIAWVFFRAETLPEAGQYLLQMVNVTHWNWNAVYTNLNPEQVTFMILGILFSLPVVDRFTERFVENGRRKQVWNSLYLVMVGGVFILSICYMTGSGFNPFIYFRF